MKKKVLICVGTRPEAIKMAPIIYEFKKHNDYDVHVCSTGQHKEMVNEIFAFFGIVPDVDFEIMGKSRSILDLNAKLLEKFDLYLDELKPDLILAQGDTTSVLASAVSAYYKKIPFGHIEAGLRTYNRYSPWPEEGNRVMVTAVTDLHFAPTPTSRDNLLHEMVEDDRIFVTGNTVIDALFMTLALIEDKPPQISEHADIGRYERVVLITGHRRENIGSGFKNIFDAIVTLAHKYPDVGFVFPVHLNPEVRSQVDESFRSRMTPNLILIDPLAYPDFVWLMKRSFFIITDSGGIQEEAPSLGKPVIVTRDTTERPEGVDAGVVRLVGSDAERIVREASQLLDNEAEYEKFARVKNPYGDGTASQRIYTIIRKHI